MIELRPRLCRRPRRPVSVGRWLYLLREEPPRPLLDAEARLRIGGLICAALQELESEPFIEDPEYQNAVVEWMEGFSPAPFMHWEPLAGSWGLCWPLPLEEQAQHLIDSGEDWDLEWLESAPLVPTLRITSEQVIIEVDSDVAIPPSRHAVIISAGRIELDSQEDFDDIMLFAAQRLTGWVPVQADGRVTGEPVRCADCGEDYLLEAGMFEACPRCGGTWILVCGDEPEQSRLTALLIASGIILLCGAPDAVSAALCPVLLSGGSGAELAAALLACPAIEEVFASDTLLDVLLECW